MNSFASNKIASISFGKQLPPKPIPEFKKLFPIQLSKDIPRFTLLTLAPVLSHKFAISFIYEILVAKNIFEAYLVISVDFSSMTTNLSGGIKSGE